MSSTAPAPRLFALRSLPRALPDLAVVAVVLAVSLSLLTHGGPIPFRPGLRPPDVLGVVLVLCSAAPLPAWRRFPLAVFVVTAAAITTLAGLDYRADLMPGPMVALYLLATGRDRPTAWTRPGSAVVTGMLVAYLGATAVAQRTFPAYELLHTGLPWALAWSAGERTRLRREQIADLRRRARHAEREAERDRRLAVAEERARIARDLHDSAGHAVSLIAVRAGAARLRRDPDRALATLRDIEELARRTVRDIDQIIGTLREPADEDVQPPAGLASLDTLIAQHRATGLEVLLDVTGPRRSLSGAADQAAYRILQEALRNAARHGTGGARAGLHFTGAALEITVVNPVHGPGLSRSGGGHGLIGMRERVTLIGGSLDAGRDGATYRVHARVPYGDDRPCPEC
ncbi:histidine kinase [Sphaerisporangium sp. B11E5]|uniref:sensor histidine kinase n=1 Tax=Sphaerisporangium sp. B11E5 TaxID=3153563 RepID=UPI00325EE30A